MVILYVDPNDDDAFFFAHALKQVAPGAICKRVVSCHEAKCYLKGEGRYENREEFPAPQLVVADSRLPDGSGLELLQWARSQPDLISLQFCLFTDPGYPRELPTNCVFEKPNALKEWPEVIRGMLGVRPS
jgi:CheY-like chemotaxis protein